MHLALVSNADDSIKNLNRDLIASPKRKARVSRKHSTRPVVVYQHHKDVNAGQSTKTVTKHIIPIPAAPDMRLKVQEIQLFGEADSHHFGIGTSKRVSLADSDHTQDINMDVDERL